jgi:hypothetical protein
VEPDGAAERRRDPPPGSAADPAWHEGFDLCFWSPQGSFGGHLTVLLWPALRTAWYWTAVVERDRPVVSLLETEVALPRRGLELRAPGLWADQNCETPWEHWSFGLEAFAVRLDRPTDALGGFRGERIGLGYDLEWESDDRPPGGWAGSGGYGHEGRVHGEVLVGPDTYELDGGGRRAHWWGTQPWPAPLGPQPDAGDEGEEIGRSLAELPFPSPVGTTVVERRLVVSGGGPAWSSAARSRSSGDAQ